MVLRLNLTSFLLTSSSSLSLTAITGRWVVNTCYPHRTMYEEDRCMDLFFGRTSPALSQTWACMPEVSWEVGNLGMMPRVKLAGPMMCYFDFQFWALSLGTLAFQRCCGPHFGLGLEMKQSNWCLEWRCEFSAYCLLLVLLFGVPRDRAPIDLFPLYERLGAKP